MNGKLQTDVVKICQKQLSTKKLDALFISDPYNIRHLSGFTGTNGQLFITPKNAYLITDFRYIAVAKKILPPSIQLIKLRKHVTRAPVQRFVRRHYRLPTLNCAVRAAFERLS